MLHHGDINALTFLQVYRDLHKAKVVSPRGMLCKELTDYSFQLSMGSGLTILTSFKARKLSLKYAKEEFLWYLRADRFDRSIEQHASMWAKIRQPDGGFNSNYGQYIFPDQFRFVVEELAKDRDSRRASVVLLKQDHLTLDCTDVVCTYGINFRIRDDRLHMTVMMRSNDAIFGTTNDAFCFCMLYRMVYICLISRYPSLQPGIYTHFANSLHVYERHFSMLEELLIDGYSGFEYIPVPWPMHEEIQHILTTKDTKVDRHMQMPMLRWLNA